MKFLLSSLLLFIVGCSSPLEDIELTDFEAISARFYVERDTSTDGVTDEIYAIMEDKNFKNMELKGAVVSVNGVAMKYHDGATNRYETSSVKIESNTKYVFTVTLSNGDTAGATLTTPEVHFGAVAYPKPVTPSEGFVSTWSTKGGKLDIKYELSQDGKSYTDNYYDILDQGIYSSKKFSVGSTYMSCNFSLLRSGTFAVSSKFDRKSARVQSKFSLAMRQ